SGKQPLTDAYPSGCQSKARAMPRQKLMPISPADPEADDLAHDRRDDPGRDQVPDVDAVRPGGEKPGRDQGRLGGQWNADTFESNEGCDHPHADVRADAHPYTTLPT